MNKRKDKKNQQGYSLIELVVVVGLTSILAIAITAIMMTTLISSTRVRRLAHVRQSGDFALNQVQQIIRNSKTLEECSSDNGNSMDDYVITTSQDGGQTTLEADLISEGVYRIASSSASTKYLIPEDIVLENFDLSCQPDDNAVDLVQISFTLTAQAEGERPFETPSVTFETTIKPRNR